jgi:FdrA protein
MGPDCGTAIVNGIGLGFANRVRRGPFGLVGASGTGLQAVTSAIHNLGSGVSHAFGTGGRDVKTGIGGCRALQGLETLADDPDTRVIVLVSKPPDPAVAAGVLSVARRIGKPVVVNFIGYPPPSERSENLHFAVNLSDAAARAVQLAAGTDLEGPSPEVAAIPAGRFLRGLFSGGTLAVESVLGLQNVLHPLFTNVPIRPDQDMGSPLESRGHTIVDLGEDVFTQGRLHPMMDNDLRIRRIRQEAEDETTGLILLDVVLGEGAHPDPAAELGPVVAELTTQHGLPVIAVLVGTEDDPQDRDSQAERLAAAGAQVFHDLQAALVRVSGYFPPKQARTYAPIPAGDLAGGFAAINAGLEAFSESLAGQGAEVVQMDWRPPAGGNEKMAGILERLRAASGD